MKKLAKPKFIMNKRVSTQSRLSFDWLLTGAIKHMKNTKYILVILVCLLLFSSCKKPRIQMGIFPSLQKFKHAIS